MDCRKGRLKSVEFGVCELCGLKCLLQEVTGEAREEDGTVKESVLVEKQREMPGVEP